MPPALACGSSPADQILKQQTFLKPFGRAIQAVAAAIQRDEQLGIPELIELKVCLQGSMLQYTHIFDARTIRFKVRKIGPVPILDVITYEIGGSTSHRVHLLLQLRRERIVEAVPVVEMQDQDGFFVGDLGARGPGVVFWGPDWDDNVAHHAPRHYLIRYFTLDHGRLVPSRTDRTAQPLQLDDADAIASALKLPVRDQTRRPIDEWPYIQWPDE